MLVGRCCKCKGDNRPVTLKAFAMADGSTEWEYGPGSWWRHHYGADAISGLVPDVDATPNTYVLSPFTAGSFQEGVWVDRNGRLSGALAANASESLTITKLDSLDGSVIESAVLGGWFVAGMSAGGWANVAGTIAETAALSGGDFLIVGWRPPCVEYVDYTTDTANKEYVLHAHTQQAGNVYFRTWTSNETITLAYNATAADVAAAFLAAVDCTAATATGGPWPHRKIELSVTWSAASGDIRSIKVDATYTASTAGTCTWDWDDVANDWAINTDNCATGTTATPPDRSGSTGETGIPGTCAGGTPATGTRSVRGWMASYDTGTGLISNSAGYVFGRDNTTPSRLMTGGQAVPTNNTPARLQGWQVLPAAENRIVCLTERGAVGNTIEAWTVAATWGREWQYWLNTDLGTLLVFNATLECVENDTALVTFANRTFGASLRCACAIAVDANTRTELSSSVVGTNAAGNAFVANQKFRDGNATDRLVYDYEAFYQSPHYPSIQYRYRNLGSEVYTGANELLLGADTGRIYGWTTDAIFAESLGAVTAAGVYAGPPSRTPPRIASTNASAYAWRWDVWKGRSAATQDFRFVFLGDSQNLNKTTGWIAWTADKATIKAAIDAVFDANTGGVVDNVLVYPFGDNPDVLSSSGESLLDRGLVIRFAGFANAAGRLEKYIHPTYLEINKIRIEFQDVADFTARGIAAWSATNGSTIWARTWGSKDGVTKVTPGTGYQRNRWIRGSLVYAYGELIDSGT
jgi:hypothetical protein